MGSKLYCIGEALIDFIPKQKGVALKGVLEFERVPGGAPANVSAAAAKLGGNSSFISKLGQDAFAEVIIETLNSVGVDTSKIYRTDKANTGLAFVSLQDNGERDFSFYRNPSADMLLDENEIKKEWFSKDDILHFCSVDLINAPVKEAHKKAIELMLNAGGIVSFDPNVRLPLWKSSEECRSTILQFIPYAHIIKISDDELEFITGIKNEKQAILSLFKGNVQAVIYTCGASGASYITRQKEINTKGFKISVCDTTGAGDSFIGALLYKILENEIKVEDLSSIHKDIIEEILTFANACAALTTTKKGAIFALPSKSEVLDFVKNPLKF